MSDPREIWVVGTYSPPAAFDDRDAIDKRDLADAVRYVHGEEYDRLKAHADALYEALGDLFIGMVQQANQEGPGPTGADMLAAEDALRVYRSEGGEQ